MKTRNFKKWWGRLWRPGFTLVEVNLAIFIMAVGILSMCALYSLGYRESSQSVEDVNAAAYADVCLAPLIAGLSSPQLTWSDWTSIGTAPNTSDATYSGIDGRWPANGWLEYIGQKYFTDENTDLRRKTFQVNKNPKAKAIAVYNQVKSRLSSSGVTIEGLTLPQGYQAALVVTRSGAVIQLAFRISRRAQSLMSQPVFVSEVHFQGGFKQEGVQ